MNQNRFRLLAGGFLLMVLFASCILASEPAIGFAAADGSFTIDHGRVWGNATLFNGSVIETGTAGSQIRLQNGALVKLAAGTHAIVYQGRTILESGASDLMAQPGYEIETRSLRISARDTGSIARIRLASASKVTVASLHGSVRVRNSQGLLVAEVAEGASMDFEPQPAGASAPVRASGCLLEKDSHLILAEQTANVLLEVRGANLVSEIGNRIEITGIGGSGQPGSPVASQAVKVVELKRIAAGGCTAIAKRNGARAKVAVAAAADAAAATGGSGTGSGAAAASTTGAAGTAAGVSAGTVAVIGGVAAAATVGGLAAVGSLPGQAESTPSASR